MKKIIKFLIAFCITTIFYINFYNVYGSFADFTDGDARNQTEKMEQEQNKKFDTLKSNNNYLSSLSVEGYELSPEFDKQTLEYTLNKKIKESEINIKAIADDSKATVTGTGNIKINKNQNKFRIDVTAESGTVRTYIIKITQDDNSSTVTNVDENSTINDMQTTLTDKAIINEIENQEENNKIDLNKKMIVVIAVIFIVLIVIIKFFTKKKSAKHKK